MTFINLLKHDTDGTVTNATVEDMLLADDPRERMTGRLYATGAYEAIAAWLQDEISRRPQAETITAMMQVITVLHLQTIASVVAQMTDDSFDARHLVDMQSEMAAQVIPERMATIRGLNANGSKADRPSGPLAGSAPGEAGAARETQK